MMAALLLCYELTRKRRRAEAARAEAHAYEKALKATRQALPAAPSPLKTATWESWRLAASGFNVPPSALEIPGHLLSPNTVDPSTYENRLLFGRFQTSSNPRVRQGTNLLLKAEDVHTGRTVLLKILRPYAPQRDRERCEVENFCLANGGPYTPELIAAYELDTGQRCLVMNKLPGLSLETLLERSGSFGVRQQIELARRLVRALQYLHEQLDTGHHDIKPANILVSCTGEGDALTIQAVHLIDFDLASPQAFNEVQASLCRGTPSYSAPEAAIGVKVVSQLVDQFALGATLYEMFVEHRIVAGDDALQVSVSIAQGHYIEDVQRDLSDTAHPGYAQVIARMLAHNPRDRYPSMAAVAVALAELSERAP